MKKIMYLMAGVMFLASCSKNDSTPEVVNWNPHPINEIQENMHSDAKDFVLANAPDGKRNNIDFQAEMILELSLSLHVGFAVEFAKAGDLGEHTFAPSLKQITDMITYHVENPVNLADTIDGWHRQSLVVEDGFSDTYKDLIADHHDIRFSGAGFQEGNDKKYHNILQSGQEALDGHEYNMLQARSHPHIVNHNLFESGDWDEIKDAMNGDDKFIISCAIAAAAAITIAEAASAAAIVAAAAVTAANVSTIVKNSSKDGVYDGYNIPYIIQMNQAVAAAASIIDLVMNHTTE